MKVVPEWTNVILHHYQQSELSGVLGMAADDRISLIIILNNVGFKTLPCGTPFS